MKKGKKVLIWAAGVLGVLIPASWFLLDYAIRSAVSSTIRNAEKLTGREITVRNVDTGPYTITAIIHDLEVKTPDRKGVFMSISTVRLSKSLSSYWKGATILNSLDLQAPRINLERTGRDSFNFSDIIQNLKKKQEQGGEEKPGRKKKHAIFSASNVTVTDGSIRFIDRAPPGGVVNHTVRDLDISIPYVSNDPGDVGRAVEIRAGAEINGATLKVAGKAHPFAATRDAALRISLAHAGIPLYQPYMPSNIPLAVDSGTVSLGLGVTYSSRRGGSPLIDLAGDITVDDLSLKDRIKNPLLSAKRLGTDIRSTDLAARTFDIKQLSAASIDTYVSRSSGGVWNFRKIAEALAERKKETAPGRHARQRTFTARVAHAMVRKGRIHFLDSGVSPAFRTDIRDINLDMDGFSTAQGSKAGLRISLNGGKNEKLTASGSLSVKPVTFEGDLTVSGIGLSDYYPYLARYLAAPVKGELESSAHVLYGPQPGDLRVNRLNAALSHLYAPFGGGDFARISAVRLKDGNYDKKRDTASLREFSVAGGTLKVSRSRDGRLSMLDLFRRSQRSKERGAEKKKSKLTYSVKNASLAGLYLEYRDNALSPTQPVQIKLRKISARVSKVEGPRFGTMPFLLSMRCGKEGSIRLSGLFRPKPLRISAHATARNVPLTDLSPYTAGRFDIVIADGRLGTDIRADMTKKGNQLEGSYKGNLRLQSVRLLNASDRKNLLLWEMLRVDDIRGKLKPLELIADRVLLNEYYANIVINEGGSINFRRVLKKARKGPEKTAKPRQAWPKPKISIEQVTLEGGVLDFSDYSLAPRRYATRFVQLGGRVSGLSSEPGTLADVDLRGSLENHSPIRISGELNPFVKPLYVDLKADFANVELPPLTPYSATYLGYRIEQGKLRATLNYTIKNRQIRATNRILIDQLFFGRKVKSGKAVALPVPVPAAVGLLKNRQGQIELNVPVKGSTNKPHISMGQVVWEAVKDAVKGLFRKMLNPFSFLFGNRGEEFRAVYFDYGEPLLSGEQKQKLAGLARKMEERPGLKLDVTGYVDRNRDPEAYRRFLLRERMRMAKYLDMLKGPKKAPQSGHVPDNVQITKQDYHKYLKKVYAQASFPRPRNIFGGLKNLSDDEMRKLLLAHTVVGDQQLRQLSRQRSNAVIDFLTKREKIDPSRLFLRVGDIFKKPERAVRSDARVEFSLATEKNE